MPRKVSALASSQAMAFPRSNPSAAATTSAPASVHDTSLDGWPAWLDAAPVVTIVADLNGRVCFINVEGRTTLGGATAEALLKGGVLSEAFAEECRKVIADEGIPTALRSGVWHGEGCLLDHRGRETPMALTISARSPAETWLVCVACNITHQKQRERKLEHLAMHDALTGLPNLTLFSDRLARELHGARRSSRPFAVLFLDIDRFKELNDNIGHEGANRVLVELAVRLYSCVRAMDTVARYGGDEFAIILANLNDAAEAEAIVQRIRICVSRPFSVEGSNLEVGVSIGCAMFPADSGSAEGLIAHADRNMYGSKRRTQHAGATERSLRLEQQALRTLSMRKH